MVIRRNDNETDSDFISRLGEVIAAEEPPQHVCSILVGSTFPPANAPTELMVEARAAVGRPVISVPAGAPSDAPSLFVVWQLDTTVADRGYSMSPGAIVCSGTAAGAFERLPMLCQHFAQHGWSPNHR